MRRYPSLIVSASLFALLLVLFSSGAAQDHRHGNQPDAPPAAAPDNASPDNAAPRPHHGDNANPHPYTGQTLHNTDEDERGDGLERVTRSITIGETTVEYVATTGRMTLATEEGKPRAEFFFVSYEQVGADINTRPVTFTFNGGPGAASVWLHLGAFGPRRIAMGPEGFTAVPPYNVVDNVGCLLDATDMVFIDPVSTGYSRPAEGEKDDQFHGLEEDISSVGEFIHLWTNRNKRWASPKFLCGESYGTTRAAGLSDHLQNRYGMYLNGVILVSAILNFQTASFSDGNDLAYALFLPAYTATAHFHGKLQADLQKKPLAELMDEVRKFASGDYTTALMAGDTLSDSSRKSMAYRVARYTGLTSQYVEHSDLRIHIQRFCAELLRDQRLTVGRLDSRYKGVNRDGVRETPDYDPFITAIVGPYATAFNRYVRDELGYESDLPYEVLTGRVHPWNYRGFTNRYVNVAPRLRSAMTKNPHLKVFVANGYFDLGTPFYATEYTFSHLGLPADLRDNVTMAYYESGHMMYVREHDLTKLHTDVAAFIRAAVAK